MFPLPGHNVVLDGQGHLDFRAVDQEEGERKHAPVKGDVPDLRFAAQISQRIGQSAG
jgi:hypothetical protein